MSDGRMASEDGLGGAERGITPVAGHTDDTARQRVLKRGVGAVALVCFTGLVLWGTWHPKGAGRSEERPQRVVVRQSALFEPAREAPPPPAAAVQLAALPVMPPMPATTPPVPRSPADDLLDASRRAPVVVFNRSGSGQRTGSPTEADPTTTGGLGGGAFPYGAGEGTREPRNELGDRLKPTPLEGVRAARLPNRHLVVTQGTAVPCVLETAMSSDVPGFVSCVVQRDVMSDSGAVVLMEKGTQVVGEYRGNLRRGSRRMFVLWNRAKTPTGVIVNLASPATDALGRSGFDGEVDSHFWERFGAGLLLSIVNDAGSFASRQLADADIEIRSTEKAGGSAAAIAVERSIDIPPTLNKRHGELVSIFVARDLDFSSVYGLRLVGTRTERLDRAAGLKR